MAAQARPGVASADVDINSCQLDVTQVDLRDLAASGQVSDSRRGTSFSSAKISSETTDDVELRRDSTPGLRGPIEVSRPSEVVDFRTLNIRTPRGAEAQVQVLLDGPDAARLGHLSWYLLVTKQGKRYAVAHGPNGRLLYLHREVMAPLASRAQVDHRDGNTLDNRRLNLRVATPGQQRANSRKKSDRAYSSRFKGVSRPKGCARWLAQIRLRRIGYFATEEEAARAYDAAAVVEFGEFACLNFPSGVTLKAPEASGATAPH